MEAMCQSKFIKGDQHHLYLMLPEEDWSHLPWRIAHKEFKNCYWIPVKVEEHEKIKIVPIREKLEE